MESHLWHVHTHTTAELNVTIYFAHFQEEETTDIHHSNQEEENCTGLKSENKSHLSIHSSPLIFFKSLECAKPLPALRHFHLHKVSFCLK